MPSNYSGPITTVPPSLFEVITDPDTKYLLTSDGKRILWSQIIDALQAEGFLDELFINEGSGITITGAGTEGDPLVIATQSSAAGNATVVVRANLAELQGVGDVNTVYYVFDTDGQGSNGIYAWNATASAYQSMTPGGSGGGASVRSDLTATGLTGKAKSIGGNPSLAGSAGSYTLTIPSEGDLRGFRLNASDGSAATDGSSNLTLDIVSADGDFEYGTFQVIDGNTGQLADLPALGINVTFSEPSAGTLRILFPNIGGFTSFKILFSPCA